MRPGMILLGLGLIVLWLVGLNNHAAGWLVWLDFLAALVSFALAASPSPTEPLGGRMAALVSGGPLGLALGLLVLWIIGLAFKVEPWLDWWNFSFGVAYGLLGAGVAATTTGGRQRPVSGPRTL